MPGIAVSAGHHSPGADRSRQGREPTYGGPEAQGHGAGRQTMAWAGRTNGRTAPFTPKKQRRISSPLLPKYDINILMAEPKT